MPQVLIVEDDENDAYFIQRAFIASGVSHTPRAVVNKEEAIRYLEGVGAYRDREQFPFPKILVTDIKMPGGSGLELLAWIRDHPELRIIPTVVMSSSSQVEDVKCAYCLGANAYLCKPIDHEKFKDVFGALLRFWSFCEIPQSGTPSCKELIEKYSVR